MKNVTLGAIVLLCMGGSASGAEFAEPVSVPLFASGLKALQVADMDGDGDDDIVSASANDAKLAWVENDGFGNFVLRNITTESNNQADPVNFQVLDADRDSDADLIVQATAAIYFWNQGPTDWIRTTISTVGGGIATGEFDGTPGPTSFFR